MPLGRRSANCDGLARGLHARVHSVFFLTKQKANLARPLRARRRPPRHDRMRATTATGTSKLSRRRPFADEPPPRPAGVQTKPRFVGQVRLVRHVRRVVRFQSAVGVRASVAADDRLQTKARTRPSAPLFYCAISHWAAAANVR